MIYAIKSSNGEKVQCAEQITYHRVEQLPRYFLETFDEKDAPNKIRTHTNNFRFRKEKL